MHVGGKCRKWMDGRGVRQMILELDLHSTVQQKLYEKFQLNMSKNAGEKCGKLCISSILIPKRGITPTKIDAY